MEISEYIYQTKPYDHQRIAFETTARKVYYAYLADLGTGKTKITLDVAAYMYMNKWIDALMIFGNNGSYTNWIPGIEEHLPIIIPRSIGVWSSKNSKKKNEEMFNNIYKKDKSLKIFLMNIEALSWEKGPIEAMRFVKSYRTMAIVDESTTISNPNSSRTKMAVKIGRAARARRILTGSLVDNRPIDAWSQFQFLEDGALGFKSFVAFKAQYSELQDMRKRTGLETKIIDKSDLKYLRSYTNENEDLEVSKDTYDELIKRGLSKIINPIEIQVPTYRHFKVVVGPRNLDQLKQKIASLSFIVRKEDCLDLPSKTFMDYYVDLTDEQRSIYDKIKKESIAEIENRFREDKSLVTVKIALSKLLRLHQITCGHIKDDDGVVHRLKSNRITALGEQLKETRGKVLIWTTFTHDIEVISEYLTEEYGRDSFLTYYGKTKDDDREFAKKVFKRGGEKDHINFLIANDVTGGYGNNWTAITTAFYFSYDYDNNIHHQTLDRIHRIGQIEKVTYIKLKARNTVDERICEVLDKKQQVSEFLTPSNWKQMFI